MHNCAFCKNPLRPWTEWKGNDGHFYCSEFGADAGETLEHLRRVETAGNGLHGRGTAMTGDLAKKGMQDRTRRTRAEQNKVRFKGRL